MLGSFNHLRIILTKLLLLVRLVSSLYNAGTRSLVWEFIERVYLHGSTQAKDVLRTTLEMTSASSKRRGIVKKKIKGKFFFAQLGAYSSKRFLKHVAHLTHSLTAINLMARNNIRPGADLAQSHLRLQALQCIQHTASSGKADDKLAALLAGRANQIGQPLNMRSHRIEWECTFGIRLLT